MDVKEFLQSIPAFNHLNEAEFDRLVKLARVRQAESGETIDAQGAPADRFYILVHGRVAVVLGLDFGVSSSEYMVTTIGPGQMFAWSGMVGNPKYTASGKMLTDCTVLEFDVPALEKEFEADPQLGYAVMRAVAQTIASRLRKMQLQLVKQHAIRESVE
jgi:CRP-like cAMP-binding protein